MEKEASQLRVKNEKLLRWQKRILEWLFGETEARVKKETLESSFSREEGAWSEFLCN